ncbi:helix-turn-helix transcriptional regulator [Nocardia otitidiscaviarum]|uniref:helix-turn-helix domain-containing protein n=2 Tax=Nocardia otitidiscaviarum TaxID=1823 RepID=UPI00130D7EA4|nr:helix-turn-helix transcriptional regulator [Nocardia otitidiscaviarum]MBF6133919.1 helix-turn-helix transcriptional regulator [Nocardia otitidiscaviarum]MBF6484420.1 helix-turn-helix transcriptional regulator [Nocardia otitidiscaviarum]
MRSISPESPSGAATRPTIGAYMQRQRILLGLTQQQVADRLYMSKSAYQKHENGERNPTVQAIRDWCDALELTYEKRRKVISIVMGELVPVAIGSPENITDDDLDFINSLPYPAWLHRVPQYDILAGNRVGIEMCPFLDPALATGDRPLNVMVQFASDPRAQQIVTNTDTVLHRLIYFHKEMAAGIVPEDELAAIRAATMAHPKAEHFWNTPMEPELFDDDQVVMVDPTGRETHWRMRSLQSIHPWCDYEIFLLTPRTIVGGTRRPLMSWPNRQ